MTTQDKDLAVAREMLDAEIAAMAKTLAERDALCEQQTRTIHGIPALMRERDAEKARAAAAEKRLAEAFEGAYQMEGQANDQQKRADAAEQMVCEMRGALQYYATRHFDSRGYSDSQLQAHADSALARTEPVAGRWVPVAEHADAVRCVISRQERIEALEAERDAAIAAKEAAESREHALGVQMVALRERVRLLEPTVPALRHALATFEAYAAGHRERGDMTKAMRDAAEADSIRDALLPLDAVPGDALATCKPGLQVGVDYREASGVDVERVSVERGVLCRGCGRMVGPEGCYEHGLEQTAYDGVKGGE